MITVCTALAIVPSSAASYESDEYDAAANGFTVTVKDARGLNAGNFDAAIDYEAVQYLYENGYAGYDSYGKHKIESNGSGGYTIDGEGGKTYTVPDPSGILTKADRNAPHFGGYYHSGKSSSLPMNKYPIDIDIHLGDSPVTVSGMRIYPRQDSVTQGGGIRAFEVYVKFGASDEWHYLYKDGRTTDIGSTIISAFGYNAAVTDVRIRVTDVYGRVGPDNLFVPKNSLSYFNIGWITMLKPYNAGGPEYALGTPKTVTSAEDSDEMDVSLAKYGYMNTGVKSDVRPTIDNDRTTGAQINGGLTMDFGKNITVSGFRYYPQRGKVGLYGFKTTLAGEAYSGTVFAPPYGVIQIDDARAVTFSGDKGIDLAAKFDSLKKFDYPTVNGEVDYTMPVTVLFDRNYTIGGLSLSGWHQTNGVAGESFAGEIKLLKPDTTNDEYLKNTIEWNNAPSMTCEATAPGAKHVGKEWALFDRVVVTNYPDVEDHYIYRGVNFAGLSSGNTVTMTIDLGKQYTFSAVRVVGRYGQPDQALMRGILSFSDDKMTWADAYTHTDTPGRPRTVSFGGNNLIKYSSSGSIYTDMKAKTFERNYNVTARYIKIKVLKTSGDHFSAQEIALVKPDSALDTLSVADFAGAAVDTRVAGSIEQSKTLDAAESFVSEMSSEYSSAYSAAQSAYNSAGVKESLSVLFGTATATSPHTKGDGCVPTPTTTTDSGPSIDITPLTDGLISTETDIGRGFIARGDYTVFPNRNEYFHITLPVNTTDSFTGIRFYSRKGDDTTVYNLGNCAKNVKVKLYGADGSENVESGVLTATKGRQYTSGSDIMYTDISLKFNDKAVRLTDVSKIEITVLMNFGGENGGNNHWGAEEVRLLNDSTVTNEKIVSELASELEDEEKKNSVKLEIIKAESGIYPGAAATQETEATEATGIIRFITKFNEIKEGTTITEFGTYVITSANHDNNSNLSDYSNSFASYTGETPAVGDTFSVDVTGITETNWNTPVVAISFVKIEGYNNLIISGIKLLDKVDSANELSK